MTRILSDAFVREYLACALWTAEDAQSTPRENDIVKNASIWTIPDAMVARAQRDCDLFRAGDATHAETTALLQRLDDDYGASDEQHGHDFWLTRNGHGEGFWSRGYPSDIGDALTKAAHAFGELTVMVGDDDELYFAG